MGKVPSDKDTALAFVHGMKYKAYLYSSIHFFIGRSKNELD